MSYLGTFLSQVKIPISLKQLNFKIAEQNRERNPRNFWSRALYGHARRTKRAKPGLVMVYDVDKGNNLD